MKPRTRSSPARASSRGGVTAARPARVKRAPASLKASVGHKTAGKRSAPAKIKASGRPQPARRKPVTGKSLARTKGTARRGPNASPPAAPGLLTLNADCTLTEAESLQATLVGLLEEPQAVTLDAAQVRRVDAAALQLLAAFVRDRRLAGRTVDWRGAEQILAPAASLLDMSGMLAFAGESR